VLDGHTVSNPSVFSAFFAKTGAIANLPNIESRFTSDVTLSPNPTTGYTSVRWKGEYSSVQVLEATGRIAREYTLKPAQTSADITLQNLAPGMYYIRLQGPAGSTVGKVILRP
jgi:hypothetical protein